MPSHGITEYLRANSRQRVGRGRPDIPWDENGTTEAGVDFALRSGVTIQAGAIAMGRPISERALVELASALNKSALTEVLFDLTRFAGANVEIFHPEGSANRSNTATFVYRLEPGNPAAFEVTARI